MLEHGFLEALSPENTVQEWMFLFFFFSTKMDVVQLLIVFTTNILIVSFVIFPTCRDNQELYQAAAGSRRLSAGRKSSQNVEEKISL